MIDQERNAKIARACGKTVVAGAGLWLGQYIIKHWDGPDNPYEIRDEDKLSDVLIEVWAVSDYLNDLNACHEMEKALNDIEAVRFRLWLSRNSDGKDATFQTVEAAMCHATARQRAEAFERVKGII